MENICVIGLGYVGLPVALAISKKFNTIGYDINKKRLFDLKRKIDSNKEFSKKDFLKKKISFTSNYKDLKRCNFFIVCVPTPITINNIPNLSFVNKSISLLAKLVKKGDTLSPSIAAASIYAKCARDALMVRIDKKFNGYGFLKNKGYGTKEHKEKLMLSGPTQIHRMSFKPMKDLMYYN